MTRRRNGALLGPNGTQVGMWMKNGNMVALRVGNDPAEIVTWANLGPNEALVGH